MHTWQTTVFEVEKEGETISGPLKSQAINFRHLYVLLRKLDASVIRKKLPDLRLKERQVQPKDNLQPWIWWLHNYRFVPYGKVIVLCFSAHSQFVYLWSLYAKPLEPRHVCLSISKRMKTWPPQRLQKRMSTGKRRSDGGPREIPYMSPSIHYVRKKN